MNRRGFLKAFGIGAAVVVGIPKALFADRKLPSIPTVEMTLESTPIVATTRKLKAEYTVELAQDLKYYHGLDTELELTNMMKHYVGEHYDALGVQW